HCANSSHRTSLEKMLPEKFRYPLHLIIVLRRTGEKTIVAASLVVLGFYWLTCPSQCGLKVARHPHIGERRSAIGRTVGGTMQHQDRNFDFVCPLSELLRITGRIQHGCLYGACPQDVIQGRSTTTRVSKQRHAVRAYAW